MTKLARLILVLILVISAQSQFRPKPPVRILNRRVSIPTFTQFINSVFCAKCSYPSKFCNDNIDSIIKIPQTDHFNPESIQQNVYRIKEANVTIGTVEVSCTFPNRDLVYKKMDFILYMPISKLNMLKGVVIYYHRTLLGMKQVPTSSSDQISAIAGLYVANAYAIIFINYLGYGQFEEYPHPYVQDPTCHVKSSILALNKALRKLKAEFPAISRFRLFAAGYSEGAAYALWLERCLSRPQDCGNVKLDDAYEYQAAAAMGGPYDLVRAFKPFLTSQVTRFPEKDNAFHIGSQEVVNFKKAPLLAMTLMSYIFFSKGANDYSEKMNAEFWKMQCTRKSDGEKCQVDNQQYESIFEAIKSKKDSIAISESISHSAFGKKYNKAPSVTYLGAEQFIYESDWTNSAYGLAQKQLMDSPLFDETFHNASAINNVPQHNVFLFSLKRDSVFSPINTFNYIEAHKNTGKVSSYIFDNSLYQVCELNQHYRFSVDHDNAQFLANLFALSFIKNNTRLQD